MKGYEAAELEEEFLKTLPPEDVPLDDDLPDFMDEHQEEFEKFCDKKASDKETISLSIEKDSVDEQWDKYHKP